MVANAAAEIRTLESARDKTVATAQRAKAKAESVNSSIGKPCSTCGKPYTSDDLAHVHESHTREVKTHVQEGRDLISELTAQKERHDKIVMVRDRLIASTPDVSAITEQISVLTRRLGDVKSRQVEIKSMEAELGRATALVRSITEADEPTWHGH